MAFESVHQYVSNLKFFLHEVNEGMYIQQSLESILQDDEGKQLLVIQKFPFLRYMGRKILHSYILDRSIVFVWCNAACPGHAHTWISARTNFGVISSVWNWEKP